MSSTPQSTSEHVESVRNRRVAIVVLGDLGRSPRMQYHARSLADAGAEVDLVGYVDNDLFQGVEGHPRIRVHGLRRTSTSEFWRRHHVLFVLYSIVRVSRDTIQLMRTLLFGLNRPDTVLVQNPPSIPTLFVALAAARLRSARYVIDWHNYGYSMIALRLGQRHPAVGLHRWLERVCGRRADRHLCVSEAMRAQLSQRWGIADPVLLYDRPARGFAPTPPGQARELLARLREDLDLPSPPKPLAWVVCPTSWTLDEDLSPLLEIAAEATAEPLPDIAIIVTGQGPTRAQFERHAAGLRPSRLHLRTLWLPYRDYQSLLGAAHLGLCFHRSSSKVDLPMKVMDMFGAGLPVCALDYGPCLAEQVQHRVNGLVFTTAAELAAQLRELFSDFPHGTALLNQLRDGVGRCRQQPWDDSWREHAQDALLGN